jgi:hypothetical protein
MMTKKFRINLLILDFKLGTIDNRKDYLQTWGEFFCFIIIFFVDKTGIFGHVNDTLCCIEKVNVRNASLETLLLVTPKRSKQQCHL